MKKLITICLLATMCMMDTIAKLREKYDLHMTVERYTSAETPESENKFIRK